MTLKVNKDYVFKSAFTGEEFTGTYLREAGSFSIVVWAGKIQRTIPKEWAVREYKPIEPDPFDTAQEERLWPSIESEGE